MSLKRIEVAIASSAILATLATLPTGAWFFLNNVRLQGRAADKPADSHMDAEKQDAGFRYIGTKVDADGLPTDIVCSTEVPASSFRINEDGKRVRGTSYLGVTFRGSIGTEARRKAMSWDTVSIFGTISTTRDDKTKQVYTRLEGMYLTNGTETVSAQLLSDESKTFFVSDEPTKGKQAQA